LADAHLSSSAAPSAAWAPRFLKLFFGIVFAVALIVALVNLAAFSLMIQPRNLTLVQLLDGWGRTYKPILHDTVKPEVVVFGASWARDSFDADELSNLLGKRAFNHAVTGGQPYENRRFIESALIANPAIETIILPVDSQLVRPNAIRFNYGFDEAILNVDANGQRNPYVTARRAYAVTLSGAAVGINLDLFRTMARLSLGATKEGIAPSYQRRNFAGDRSLPPRVPVARADVDRALARAGERPDPRPFAEMAAVLAAVCTREMTVHFYFTPHLLSVRGTSSLEVKLATLSYLKERAPTCRARLTLTDFDYPNAVTLEDQTNKGLSLFFRPDGHPRATVGTLIAARLADKPMPAWAPAALASEFGVDLLKHPDPVGWLAERARAAAVP
jgi:hypothetical protein